MDEEAHQELIRLRARLVVTEHAALAALELALRIRPEELKLHLEAARKRLSESYESEAFTSDLTNPADRTLLAREVDRLMASLQWNLGFRADGGAGEPEQG
jgi:hypothetical protein